MSHTVWSTERLLHFIKMPVQLYVFYDYIGTSYYLIILQVFLSYLTKAKFWYVKQLFTKTDGKLNLSPSVVGRKIIFKILSEKYPKADRNMIKLFMIFKIELALILSFLSISTLLALFLCWLSLRPMLQLSKLEACTGIIFSST